MTAFKYQQLTISVLSARGTLDSFPCSQSQQCWSDQLISSALGHTNNSDQWRVGVAACEDGRGKDDMYRASRSSVVRSSGAINSCLWKDKQIKMSPFQKCSFYSKILEQIIFYLCLTISLILSLIVVCGDLPAVSWLDTTSEWTTNSSRDCHVPDISYQRLGKFSSLAGREERVHLHMKCGQRTPGREFSHW